MVGGDDVKREESQVCFWVSHASQMHVSLCLEQWDDGSLAHLGGGEDGDKYSRPRTEEQRVLQEEPTQQKPGLCFLLRVSWPHPRPSPGLPPHFTDGKTESQGRHMASQRHSFFPSLTGHQPGAQRSQETRVPSGL